jgi:hypothetical protein
MSNSSGVISLEECALYLLLELSGFVMATFLTRALRINGAADVRRTGIESATNVTD